MNVIPKIRAEMSEMENRTKKKMDKIDQTKIRFLQ